MCELNVAPETPFCHLCTRALPCFRWLSLTTVGWLSRFRILERASSHACKKSSWLWKTAVEWLSQKQCTRCTLMIIAVFGWAVYCVPGIVLCLFYPWLPWVLTAALRSRCLFPHLQTRKLSEIYNFPKFSHTVRTPTEASLRLPSWGSQPEAKLPVIRGCC